MKCIVTIYRRCSNIGVTLCFVSLLSLGRQFYKCPNDATTGGCNFFSWATDDVNANPNNTTIPNVAQALQCTCGELAVQRTVSKEGPNKGRMFYVCAKPMGTGCGFFKWFDQVNENYFQVQLYIRKSISFAESRSRC